MTTQTAGMSGAFNPSLLRRIWERIKYPAGVESRRRFEASRGTGYGW